MAEEVPSLELGCGAMPALGFGSGSPDDPEKIKQAVITAVELGYLHFDTASSYGTEAAIGAGLAAAIKSGLITREQVFVTSKLFCDDHDNVVEALQTSLKQLQLEYLDLFLVHFPVKLKRGSGRGRRYPNEDDYLPLDLKTTWRGMEECLQLGLTRSIGVSNFTVKILQDMKEYAAMPPSVNQVELHPVWQQKKLREYCNSVGIKVFAWSPLGGLGKPWGSSSVLDDPVIKELANKYNKTPAQVVLRWITQQGLGAVVKSYNPQRLALNIKSFDFELSEEDNHRIESIKQERLAKLEILCNSTTSPYRTIEELWDGEL